ncbi:thymidylate synthase [Synechococcus phage MA10]|jgi:thymidylate synthase (FAD)|uniref:Thymidylate synthase n=1 Tax=Synechococcus phage S-H34 TaxID=2718942 RepID=A0A6G8R6T1_9CAUD|nr:thymidylate synthase [Synechococcus phage S-H34]QIN97086.1 thymidylate synthase [Synechococcus phage S-H34]
MSRAHEEHSARLISVTPDAEEQIVYMARVSNPKNQSNMETAPRLVKYLIKHKHWSPFEMASMQVEINTTRAIAAQVLRHRSFSFQEFSQRYSAVGDLPAIAVPHLRTQDLKNKQASHDDLDPEVKERLEREIERLYANANDLYQFCLENNVAKECARSILPLGTPTRMYMSGSVRSWIHYIQIRAGIETQLEHRLIAEDCKRIFTEQFPNIAEALEW